MERGGRLRRHPRHLGRAASRRLRPSHIVAGPHREAGIARSAAVFMVERCLTALGEGGAVSGPSFRDRRAAATRPHLGHSLARHPVPKASDCLGNKDGHEWWRAARPVKVAAARRCHRVITVWLIGASHERGQSDQFGATILDPLNAALWAHAASSLLHRSSQACMSLAATDANFDAWRGVRFR
jgi:hypothetical protein